jgi:hypothetical protein
LHHLKWPKRVKSKPLSDLLRNVRSVGDAQLKPVASSLFYTQGRLILLQGKRSGGIVDFTA